jgi:hypothetical protein
MTTSKLTFIIKALSITVYNLPQQAPCHSAKYHYAVCRNAECQHGVCLYANCRGTLYKARVFVT